jgi:hypothetical protein
LRALRIISEIRTVEETGGRGGEKNDMGIIRSFTTCTPNQIPLSLHIKKAGI